MKENELIDMFVNDVVALDNKSFPMDLIKSIINEFNDNTYSGKINDEKLIYFINNCEDPLIVNICYDFKSILDYINGKLSYNAVKFILQDLHYDLAKRA